LTLSVPFSPFSVGIILSVVKWPRRVEESKLAQHGLKASLLVLPVDTRSEAQEEVREPVEVGRVPLEKERDAADDTRGDVDGEVLVDHVGLVEKEFGSFLGCQLMQRMPTTHFHDTVDCKPILLDPRLVIGR
jgi:hypothetical protein